MFNLDLSKKVENKPQERLTDDEVVNGLLQESIVRDDMNNVLSDLNKVCRTFNNQVELINTYRRFPTDPVWDAYSKEAWTVTDTIKSALDHFKEFFKKAFNYVGSFVVLRIKASIEVVVKWGEILKDTNTNKDKLEKVFKDDDTKSCTVGDIINLMNAAGNAYAALSKQVNDIKGFTNPGDNALEQLKQKFTYPAEFQKYTDALKVVESKLPTKEDPAASKGVQYTQGGWNDSAKIEELKKSFDNVAAKLLDIKRLQANCDAIVNDLGKETKDEANTAEKNINQEKIKFLRSFSKDILSGMMGNIGKYTSLAAKNCNTFVNKYNAK